MIRHNLKLFFRNIEKNKGTFMITIVGLGIGIASFLVLFLYVYNDLTYDHFHKNIANIYRVREGESVQTKGLILPEMLKEIPEIKNGTRVFDWEEFRMSYNDVAFLENIHYVDTGFFSVFTFPFIEGTADNAVHNKYGAVISKKFAKKYFGNATAKGKQLQVRFEDVFLTVNGVVDIPKNSSIQFDIVTSYQTGEEISPWIKDVHDWYNTFSHTYVQLPDGVAPTAIAKKMRRLVKENFLPVGKNKTKLNLLAFKDFHSVEKSNRTLITILALIALGIIIIAIVNFINLAVTNTLSRIKEVGIKKVNGASQRILLQQIMTESFVVSFIALVIGVLLVVLLLPQFNELFEINLQFNPSENRWISLILVLIWGIVGLLSGLIPSLLWRRAKPAQHLRGNSLHGNKTTSPRHSLIVIQFVIAIVLIAGTLLIRKQINTMTDKDPKFDNENVIVTELQSWQFPDLEKTSQNYQRIAAEIAAVPYVESVCFSGNIPGTYQENYNVFYPAGNSNVKSIHLRKAYVGENYFKTFGIKMVSGTGFEKGSISHKNAVVLNKKAMDILGFSQAKGQPLNEGSKTGASYKVVGVIDDFSYQGVQKEVQPLVHFFNEQENYTDWGYLTVKEKQGASFQVIDLLNKKWGEAFSGANAKYFFADVKLNEQYKEYIKVSTLIAWFSALAVLLSCMGLFALSSYAMAKRTKEIGIRKVNGAKEYEILSMLNRDFLKWVVLAFVIAVPFSYYAIEKWLENFAYKTAISWWIFALSGLIALTIAVVTVSWQSWKTATENPIEALRTE